MIVFDYVVLGLEYLPGKPEVSSNHIAPILLKTKKNIQRRKTEVFFAYQNPVIYTGYKQRGSRGLGVQSVLSVKRFVYPNRPLFRFAFISIGRK
jgi:hypothetical protein